MVNFGSPRVGNKAFAQEFNQLVPDAWRVVNRNDAVCTVPRLMGELCHSSATSVACAALTYEIASKVNSGFCWSTAWLGAWYNWTGRSGVINVNLCFLCLQATAMWDMQ